MNKLLKKIMAVGMAAAMASSMAVVSYAGKNDTPKPADPNTDKAVWVNGKDVKDKNDKTKITRYKTEELQATGTYAGGKWMVAVTKSDVTAVKDFVALFDAKLKNTKASETKDIAKAKIKDGKITVTAGKKPGDVNIWVYEVNNKKMVASTEAANTVQINDSEDAAIDPINVATINVKYAPSGLTFATAKEDNSNALKKIEKSEKITEIVEGEDNAKVVAIGDKKFDIDSTATLEAKSADESIATAELAAGVLTITGVKEGKFTVTVTCKESGKSVKISGKVLDVPAAPTVADGKGKITGVNKTMEYTKAASDKDTEPADNATWTAITKGTEVEVAEGTYFVRVKAAKGKNAAGTPAKIKVTAAETTTTKA